MASTGAMSGVVSCITAYTGVANKNPVSVHKVRRCIAGTNLFDVARVYAGNRSLLPALEQALVANASQKMGRQMDPDALREMVYQTRKIENA